MVIDVDQSVIRNQSWWQRRTSLERRLMRFLLLLIFLNIALIVALGVILSGRRNVRVKREIDNSNKICLTNTCNNTAAQILQDMDLTTNPCDDFYQFACGGYLNKTKIPEDESMIDAFIVNADTVEEQLKVLLEESIQSNEIKPFILLKNFYQSCMNTTAIENEGLTTIRKILKELGGWPVLENENWDENAFDWIESVYKLRKIGIDANYLIDFDVYVDEKNTSRNIIILGQAKLGLHEAYFPYGYKDDRLKAYSDFMIDVAVTMGATRINAKSQLKQSLQFEKDFAHYFLTYKALRNMTAQYNRMTISELQQRIPSIPWLDYITKALGIADITINESEIIDVAVPNYLKNLEKLLNKTPKRVLANYFIWRVVQFSLPYLTEEFRKHKFKFDQAIDGTPTMRPRWKECIIEISEKMTLALSAKYVRKYSNSKLKSNVMEIVSNIKNTFRKLLEEVDWMDEETRKRALEKADAITAHVAYPDELLDDQKLIQYYSKLNVSFESFFKSVLIIDLFETDYYYEQLREPFNKSSWLEHAASTTVNAYYTASGNDIRFTAGLLQGVIYNDDYLQYMKYGGLGFLVGHEITHGFDVQGAEYDKDGNLKNWWNNKTKKIFKQKSQCITDQYNGYIVSEIHTKLNGVNNQEENIADNGGARVAYLAYKSWSENNNIEPHLPGLNYTPKQMFWIATAHTWCGKFRDEYLYTLVDTDEHPPNSFRIFGSFRNLEYFSEDFNCPIGSKMNPKNKCRVW